MRSRQKGFIPTTTILVSYLIPLGIFGSYLTFILDEKPQVIYGWKVISLSFISVFLLLGFGVFFRLASIFPTLEISESGLKTSYWMFFRKKIKWDDVESIVYYPNGYVILKINRTGFPFTGLYYYQLMGMRLKVRKPVIVLAPGFEEREKFINEMLQYCSPRIVHLGT